MWGAIAGAALGALAGGQGSNSSQTTTRNLAPESELEKRGGAVALSQLSELEKLFGAGPGAQDVQSGLTSQRDLATMLSQYAQGGFMPGQQDISQANTLAQQLFQGQQVGLNQAFDVQRQQASRNAARMGRSGIDPVLQNQLMQGQARQQQQLNADIGSYATQFAQSMPTQRLGFAQQLAQVNQGLASQALANRQALLGLGSQLRSQEQNFRAGTASTTTSSSSGGGMMGALTGALGGGVAGLNLMQGLSKFGGGGTAAAATPLSSGLSTGSAGMNYGSGIGSTATPINGGW